MKQKIALLGLLFVGMNVLAAPTEFRFVSTLSAPAASFKEIETKGNKPVVVGGGTEVNIGSSASSQGTVTLKNKALNITNLYMEDKTTFEVGDGKNWVIGYLYVGDGANVAPKNLLVSSLYIGNAEHKNMILTLNTNTLEAVGQMTAQKAKVDSVLSIGDSTSPDFKFTAGGSSTADATFADPISQTSTETNVGHQIGSNASARLLRTASN